VPLNGSGSYSAPAASFPAVASTLIESAKFNAVINDIATALSTAIYKDGQQTITANIPFAGFRATNVGITGIAGTVGTPAINVSDSATGLYRSALNELAVSVNGVQRGRFDATGLIAGLGTFGQLTVSTAVGKIVPGATSISLRNNADNADNLLLLDGGGITARGTFASPTLADTTNLSLVASVSANALTIALKDRAGADPSANSPSLIPFRNVTVSTGDYSVLTLTGASSIVISSGSTLGAPSGTPFRLWLVLFNDGGTLRPGLINCLSGTNIFPLGQSPIAGSTAEGGAGAADSAQVFYTGTAVAAKAYVVLGYLEWQTGLTVAGTWDTGPTVVQLFGSNVPLPGSVLQTANSVTGAVATGTTVLPFDDTIPQNTEGDQYMSQAITPRAAANVLRTQSAIAACGHSVAVVKSMALFKDSVANALAACTIQGRGVISGTWVRSGGTITVTSANHGLSVGAFILANPDSSFTVGSFTVTAIPTVNTFEYADGTGSGNPSGTWFQINPLSNDGRLELCFEELAGGVSSITYKVRAGSPNAGTFTFNGLNSARLLGGVLNSYLRVQEVQA
jgi:hypothetical protein